MPKTTIKQLEQLVKDARENRDGYQRSYEKMSVQQQRTAQDLVAAQATIQELKGDIRWYKNLIQNLVGPDAKSR